MFTQTIKSVGTAFVNLVSNWRALSLVLFVYALLLASIYFFVSTREATIGQLAISFSLLITAPVSFFILQALSVNYASAGNARELLKRSMVQCWKFAVVTLPVVALTLMAWYALSKLQNKLGIAPLSNGEVQVAHKRLTMFTAARFLLVGLVAPLATIRLWIATSTSGLKSLLRNARSLISSSFDPGSIMIYVLGCVTFLFGPYFLLSREMSAHRPWVVIVSLGARIIVSALLIVVGWTTTVGALTLTNNRQTTAVGE